MDDKYDVIIVGGGPSGSTSAIYHTRLGLKTLLIDKAVFPRDKVCGDGIPMKVLTLLKEMGVSLEELSRIGYQIDRLKLYSPSGVEVKYGEIDPESEAKSFCITRYLFDNFLFQRARQECGDVYDGVALRQLRRDNGRYYLTLQDNANGREQVVSAPIVIGADGANSRVRKFLGLEIVLPEYRFDGVRAYMQGAYFEPAVLIFYDEVTLPGYFWIFPVSKTKANVGLMVEKETCRQQGMNIREMFYYLLENNGDLKAALSGCQLLDEPKGHPLPLGHGAIDSIADGAMLIGDAASFINPITGGGIYYGMYSGKQAAYISKKAVDSGRFQKEDLREFQQFFRNKLLPGFDVANKMRRYFNKSGKVDRLFDRCNHSRIVANFFISLYGRPLPKHFYLNPFYWAAIIRN